MQTNDIKQLMRKHWIEYASYVILDRAIPDVNDGLKPVQRRILEMLWRMADGKLHKVANVAGQTMALHPHGDAAIIEALVNLSNKGFLLDQQGNFGNIFTGDPAAAARYIETRLSKLSIETMFNPALTSYCLSYDGRSKEPIYLPAKIPLLLMQGADGIAVGMATHIFPHNFVELLQAQIEILKGGRPKVLPDFLTGGIMDASDYNDGQGKIKLRANIEVIDAKTLIINQICHGTTTESLIKSIDEAAKKGKVKIDTINDYTAQKVEIEIKLPRGHYAADVIDSLYAYTECEVSLNSQIIVIKDQMPWECSVLDILDYTTQNLQKYIEKELLLEKEQLLNLIFDKSLEQIFIENKIYKRLEVISIEEKIYSEIEEAFVPFTENLNRPIEKADIDKLLALPIKRISKFDIDKNISDIKKLENQLLEVEKKLKNIINVSIDYINQLIKKYGKEYPRRTKIREISQVDLKAIETKQIKVFFDKKSGFIGSKVAEGEEIQCTNFDKLQLFFDDGTYTVISIPEKQYVNLNKKVISFGVADKKTILSVVYKDKSSGFYFAKRFVIEKFILDKSYNFLEADQQLKFILPPEKNLLEIKFVPKPRQKVSQITFDLKDVSVKGVSAKGIRLTRNEVQSIKIT